MKLCSRLLMVFIDIYAIKRQIWVSEPHLGNVRGDTGCLVNGSLENPWSTFYFALIELFMLSITVPKLGSEICTSRLFSQGSTSLHSNFTRTGSSPINRSLLLGTRNSDIRLRGREDRILLCYLFYTILECDEQTDRQTDGFAVAYTALAKLALRSAVKRVR